MESKIQLTRQKLSSLPAGKLVLCSDGHGHEKWFRSDGKHKVYIKKKEHKLAEELAYKKYLTSLLKKLEFKQNAIRLYLNYYQKHILTFSQKDSDSLEYQRLLSSYFTPMTQELYDWTHASYEKNSAHPEHLTYKTGYGESVRSKSELLIYSSLHKYQIPFRYECKLQLGSAIYFPDFTIRHPETDELFYWENFGLMDNSEYAHNTFSKLNHYYQYGIIPSVNLITTYETQKHPLCLEEIEMLIELHFM